uniref:Uncharacterized protein n=1 Tax=Oncorhynchus tshawytscha TaxID=74940 RepID=A0A8C8JW16_ONCTS
NGPMEMQAFALASSCHLSYLQFLLRNLFLLSGGQGIHRKCQEKDLSELHAFTVKKKTFQLTSKHLTTVQRAEQWRVRVEREKEWQSLDWKEAKEQRRKNDYNAKKKKALTNMTHQCGGIQVKTVKEPKKQREKKILADRRKPLSIDYLRTNSSMMLLFFQYDCT